MKREKIIGFLLAAGFLAFAGVVVFVSQGCATARIRPPAGRSHIEVKMRVTGYCNCGKCCSWYRNWYGRPIFENGPNKGKRKEIGITASGSRAGWGTAAADPNRYPFGTIFHVPGYGYARVEDTGGSIRNNHIDLWFPSHQRAQAWGSKKLAVKVWLPPGTSKPGDPAQAATKPVPPKPGTRTR
ncbi:MAG: 3D domain-containing protein [Kiritimatiellia bacterium]|jgi:3D (Asp-Asp-Asp) domain-containing protein